MCGDTLHLEKPQTAQENSNESGKTLKNGFFITSRDTHNEFFLREHSESSFKHHFSIRWKQS